MQTLIDPFELASGLSALPRPAAPPRARDVAKTLLDIDIQLEEDAVVEDVARDTVPPSPDSSSRLRCWCSED